MASSRIILSAGFVLAAGIAVGSSGTAMAQPYYPPPPPVVVAPPPPVVVARPPVVVGPRPPVGWVGPHYYWHGRHWHGRRWAYDRWHRGYWSYY
ncbi:hypothetical protein [Rhizosaccharibacter radicis]|uniref:Uncharacterized protein n=1 Tax=Rhizosaccharibacter radicis TaxID=2782605 RepID=A0ABT1W3C0_9PROT|nr:hypothetical protein [Acetobacteraceae bacterium KSS12]